MKKILFISNIAGKKVGSFSLASIKAANELGFDFHMAANYNQSSVEQIIQDEHTHNVTIHHVDFERNPLSIKNFKAFLQLKRIVEKEKINYIHCNTPVGGFYGRLVGKNKVVEKVIYQAHGFHFFEGGSNFKNLLFKTIEKFLARSTDVIITINEQDYQQAKRFKMRNKNKTYKVSGVGINLEKYSDRKKTRKLYEKEFNLLSGDRVCISMGDLIKRKNYGVAIRAIKECNDSSIHYFICGDGPELQKLQKMSEDLGLWNQIHFLGYRDDVDSLLSMSDLFLFTSYQEGLPRSLMEAMAAGLPCVVSDIRGNQDLIVNGEGGFLVEVDNSEEISAKLKEILNNQKLSNNMSDINLEKIKQFSLEKVIEEMRDIYYKELINEGDNINESLIH